MKLHMALRLTYLHLTLDHAKGQGQGHAYFDSTYLQIGDTFTSIWYDVAYAFSISIFGFDLGLF